MASDLGAGRAGGRVAPDLESSHSVVRDIIISLDVFLKSLFFPLYFYKKVGKLIVMKFSNNWGERATGRWRLALRLASRTHS